MSSVFRFKQFNIYQENASLKVGTDAMVLGSFCLFPDAKSALDVGTGTGVLSLMVAQTHPNLKINAIDIDQHNCSLARYNFENSPFSKRVNVIQEDIFTYNPNEKYDFIFTNPPFHIKSLKNQEIRISKSKHFSEIEFDNFILKLSKLLSEKGKLFLIFPSESSAEIEYYMNKHRLYINERVHIYGKPHQKKRIIAICSSKKIYPKEIDFLIRDLNGNYSKEYIEKTKQFHDTEL